MIHDTESDGLIFYIYSRKQQFATKVAVAMNAFKEIHTEGTDMEETFDLMCRSLRGNMEEGFVYEGVV